MFGIISVYTKVNINKIGKMKKIKLLLLSLFLTNMIFAQSDFEYKIDSLFKKYDKTDCPGLSVGIVQNGKLIYDKGFGLANLEYSIQNSDTSKFDIASIAKQFTAACVWSLIQQGKISLDDDVRKYLPEMPFYGDTIKIRHMLNHTSGLRNYGPLLELSGIDYRQIPFNNDSVFALICRQKGLNNIPGEKVLYGNAPYNIMTIIVERTSGQSFNEYAKENIFIPLGMNNTMFRTENHSVVTNRAVGYIQNEDNTYSNFPRIESCYGAGSLWSTVEDMVLWTNIFTEKNYEYKDLAEFLMEKETLLSGEPASYSRGVMVDDYKNKQTIHHSGFTAGYQSQIISVPEIELSVIILTNLQSINPTPISYQIMDLFLKDTKTEVEQPESYVYSQKQFQEYVGQYQEKNSSMGMEIIYKNDTLWAKSSFGRAYIPLVSSDKNIFCRTDNESVKYIFTTDSKNTVVDMIVYFGANPFYFEPIVLTNPDLINNDDYVGKYYSSELNVTYTVFEENNELFLSYANNPKIKLLPRQEDEFGNGGRTSYRFKRHENNDIKKITVASNGIVTDIEFIRTE